MSNNEINNNNKISFKQMVNLVLIVTSLVCFVPFVFGLINWNLLPEEIITHYNIHGEPDGYSKKNVFLLLYPLVLLAFNIFVNLTVNYSVAKQKQKVKLLSCLRWLFPLLALFDTAMLYMFAYDKSFNEVFWTVELVGLLILVIGNFFPKIPVSLANIPVKENEFNKWKRISGWVFVIIGLIIMITGFFNIGIYVLIAMIPLFLINLFLFIIKVKAD